LRICFTLAADDDNIPQQNTFLRLTGNPLMSDQKEFRLSELPALARRHYLTGLFCLVICLFLEIWFLHYPPRGVVGENVIITGSVIGSPLVDFDSLWARVTNDDELMLQIIDRAEICRQKNRVEKLNFLNRTIRQNLKFQPENETLVKISFKRPGYNDIRPFLNCFTDALIDKLTNMGQESFEIRREKALVQYSRAIERLRFIAHFFDMPSIAALLENSPEAPVDTSRMLEKVRSDKVTDGIGRALLGELLPGYSTAQIYYEPYFNDKMKLLELFPRSPVVITARDMPPTPVQPFYELIFVLVPMAVFLIYASLLIILGRKNDAALQ